MVHSAPVGAGRPYALASMVRAKPGKARITVIWMVVGPHQDSKRKVEIKKLNSGDDL